MIESIIAFFALGTFGFWALTIVAFGVAIALLENDHEGWLTFEVGLYFFFFLKNLALGFTWWQWAIIGVIHLIVGLAWSVHKWKSRVSKETKRFKDAGENTDYTRSQFVRKVDPRFNKGRLSGWVFYWPLSVFWALTGGLWSNIYDKMAHLYRNITNKALEGTGIRIED